MNITMALVVLFLLALIYLLIIEIFTILLRLTGLTYDKAHFQVISMLTNCGFTTLDSEAVTSSKVRRKITKVTIIFGYLFTVVIMSSIVNIFLSLSNSQMENIWESILVVILAVLTIILLYRSRKVKKIVDRIIEKAGRKMMFGNDKNQIVVLDIFSDNVMAEINIVKLPAVLENVQLKDSKLKENYKVQLILIKRNNDTKSIIKGEDVLLKGDVVVLFGELKNIKELFKV